MDLSVTWAEAASPVKAIMVGKGADIIKNGSFETGDFTGWYSDYPANISLGKDGAYDGVWYLGIDANRYSGILYQNLPVVPVGFECLSFAFKIVGVYEGYRWQDGVVCFKDTWQGVDILLVKVENGTAQLKIDGVSVSIPLRWTGAGYCSDWHLITLIKRYPPTYDLYLDGKFITSTNVTPTGVLSVFASGRTTSILSGGFLFDQIRLIYGENLIKNGGFETGSLEPWKVFSYLGAPIPEIVTLNPYEGKYCVKLAQGYIQQNFSKGAINPPITAAFAFRFPEEDMSSKSEIHLTLFSDVDEADMHVLKEYDANTGTWKAILFAGRLGGRYVETPLPESVLKGWHFGEIAIKSDLSFDVSVDGTRYLTYNTTTKYFDRVKVQFYSGSYAYVDDVKVFI
jgi:hypothetical protein